MTVRPPLWKTFIVFLLPMMLSNILQALSGTLNNIYLGQMIGVGAFAVASAFFPVIFFFISFVLGLGTGASVLIGQAWGAGDRHKVKAIAGTALTVTALAGVVIAIVGGSFAGTLMTALGTPADILPEATDYARVVVVTMPLLFVFMLTTAMLRGVGDTVTPLWALCLSTAVGLIVTPALIRGWGGLPMLGAVSAAWASAVAFVIALIWLAWYLRHRKHPLAPDRVLLGHLRIDRTILRTVLRIGVPTGVQMVVMALAELVLLGLVNRFGSDATAAYGAINQVMAYVQFPAMSIAITVSILGAQAIGAGEIEQLGAITRTGLMFTLILIGGLVALAYLASRTLIEFFINDPTVVDLAQGLLQLVLWSSVVFGLAAVFSGMMRASGAVLAPTALSIFAVTVVEVPVAWALSERIGIEGVWLAYPVAFTTMLMLQATYYLLVWRHRAIRRLV